MRRSPRTHKIILRALIRLALLLAAFFIAVPALADYLGPDRTVTTYNWTRRSCSYHATSGGYSCNLTVYYPPSDSCPSTGSVAGLFNNTAPQYVCGVSWPGDCSAGLSCAITPTGNSTGPCTSGQTGCRSTPSTSTYPPATISGALGCALPGSNGWCRGGAALSLTASEPLSGYNITVIEGTRNTSTGSVQAAEPFACSGASCSVPLAEGANAFTFWAISTWGDSSSMGSSGGKLDSGAPALSGSLSGTAGNNGWLLSATLTASASDSVSGLAGISYSLDGGAWTAYSGGVPLGDGIHSVNLNAADAAGNVATASASARVDGTAPSLSLDVPAPDGANGWYRSAPVTIMASASDALSGLASVGINDGGASFTASSDGVYNLNAQAVDVAGNVASASATLKLDTTAPSLGLSTPPLPAGGWYTSTVTVSADAADAGSGLASAEVSTDGGTSWAGSATLDDGIHSLSLRAGDLAGNMASASAVVGVDSLAPSLDLQITGTPGEDGWYTTPVGLTGAATDPLSGLASVEHQVDGGGWIAGTAFNLAADGEHTVALRAADVAGNVTSAGYTVKLATSLPQLTLSAPASFRPSNGQLVIAYSVDAGVSGLADWRLSVEDGLGNELTLLASGTDPASASLQWGGAGLPAGNYLLALSATNGAGNRLTVRQPLALLSPLSPAPAAPAFVIPLRPPLNVLPVQETDPSPAPAATDDSTAPEVGQTVVTFESAPPPEVETGTANVLGSENLWWGTAAAAAIGYATALALDEQRKRKQEEAQAAAEAARSNREAAAHDQGFESYQVMIEHMQKVAFDLAFEANLRAMQEAQAEYFSEQKQAYEDALRPSIDAWLAQAGQAGVEAGTLSDVRTALEHGGPTAARQMILSYIDQAPARAAAQQSAAASALRGWIAAQTDLPAETRLEFETVLEHAGVQAAVSAIQTYVLPPEPVHTLRQDIAAWWNGLSEGNPDGSPTFFQAYIQPTIDNVRRIGEAARNSPLLRPAFDWLGQAAETLKHPRIDVQTVLKGGLTTLLVLNAAQWANNALDAPNLFAEAKVNFQAQVAYFESEHPEYAAMTHQSFGQANSVFDVLQDQLAFISGHPMEAVDAASGLIKVGLNVPAGYVDAVWQQNPLTQVVEGFYTGIGDSLCPQITNQAWQNNCYGLTYGSASLFSQPVDTAVGVGEAFVLDPLTGLAKWSAFPSQVYLEAGAALGQGGLSAVGDYFRAQLPGELWDLVTDPQVDSLVLIVALLAATLANPLLGGGIALGFVGKGLIDLETSLGALKNLQQVKDFVDSRGFRVTVTGSLVAILLITMGAARQLEDLGAFKGRLSPANQAAYDGLGIFEQIDIYNTARAMKVPPGALDFYLEMLNRGDTRLAGLPLGDALRVSILAEQSGKGAFLLDYITRNGFDEILRIVSPDGLRFYLDQAKIPGTVLSQLTPQEGLTLATLSPESIAKITGMTSPTIPDGVTPNVGTPVLGLTPQEISVLTRLSVQNPSAEYAVLGLWKGGQGYTMVGSEGFTYLNMPEALYEFYQKYPGDFRLVNEAFLKDIANQNKPIILETAPTRLPPSSSAYWEVDVLETEYGYYLGEDTGPGGFDVLLPPK